MQRKTSQWNRSSYINSQSRQASTDLPTDEFDLGNSLVNSIHSEACRQCQGDIQDINGSYGNRKLVYYYWERPSGSMLILKDYLNHKM